MQVKVIHLIKRVEQIDREIHELHEMVGGIETSRSYRDTMKIAAEKQINDLVGERVKLMELGIANPPEFLTKHVEDSVAKPSSQPRISLDALVGASHSTDNQVLQPVRDGSTESNPLRNLTKLMNIDEMLVKGNSESRPRRTEKPLAKTRAEILRDLPPLQY
jgi:hypothetical protein